MTLTVFQVPLAVSAAMLAALAVVTWRQRASPVARVFLVVNLLAIAWVVVYALDIATAELNRKVLLMALRAPFVASLPVCGLIIALHYAGHGRWLTPWRIGLLLVPVVVTFALAATSQQHPYWRTDFRVETGGEVPQLLYRRAIGHWISAAWGYGLVTAMFVLLVRAVRDVSALHRRRAAFMFAGLLVSLAPHVLYEMGITPIRGYNIAPSLFGVSVLLFFWGTLRDRVLELIPTARSVVVDQLRDAVFVLDQRDRVVDANRSALDALDLPPEQVVGRAAQDVLRRLGIDLLRYAGQPHVHEELASGEGSRRRIFDLSISPIVRAGGHAEGRIVVLRDITERELARDAELSAAALDAQREAEERIRREIAELLHGRIQNQLLGLVFQLGEVEQMWKDAPPEVLAHLRSIKDNLDRIRDREVRIASHRLYPALLDMGLAPALHMLGERYESHFAISYSVDPAFSALDAPLDNQLSVVLRETAYRIVEEALSNAQRHSRASRVEISLALTGPERDRVLITVRDNGRGAEIVRPRLGLRTVEARVRNLGGSWRLITAPGAGATLAVELPIAAPPPVTPPRESIRSTR